MIILRLVNVLCFLFLYIQSIRCYDGNKDQTSPRVNTLSDDKDDIQKQLDNEARDRLKYTRPKTIWVLHFPPHFARVPDFKNKRTALQNSVITERIIKSKYHYQENTYHGQKRTVAPWDRKGEVFLNEKQKRPTVLLKARSTRTSASRN